MVTLESAGFDETGRPMHEVYLETNDQFFDPIDAGTDPGLWRIKINIKSTGGEKIAWTYFRMEHPCRHSTIINKTIRDMIIKVDS